VLGAGFAGRSPGEGLVLALQAEALAKAWCCVSLNPKFSIPGSFLLLNQFL